MTENSYKPARLNAKGRRLWDEIAGPYDLRPDELRTLEDACREADLIERLESDLRGAPLMVKGSQGQLVASPLVSELRQHRAALNGLLKSLKLPDEGAGAGSDEAGELSAKNRAAANARWARRGAARGA